MKQLSPGFIPGTLSGCFLNPFLIGLFGSLGALESAFLRLNLLFVFFFFLSGSLGGVGSGLGKSSGFSSLYLFRASLCLWLTIFGRDCVKALLLNWVLEGGLGLGRKALSFPDGTKGFKVEL